MQRLILGTFLLFIATAAFVSLAEGRHFKREHDKPESRLILEYKWPEPAKNLKRFPHPESCLHFYVTRPDGSYGIKKCHGGEIFDYRSLRCKEKLSAKCWKDIVKKGPGHLKIGRRHMTCPFPWGLYPDIEDCSHFYDCLGGKPYHRKCPHSTLFDKAGRTCVDSREAMCADHTDVVEHGYKCPYQWGLFAHLRDCSKYYECLRKVPSIRSCERNMLFDNFKRRCMPMNTVKCDTRLNPYDDTSTSSPDQVKTESTPNIPERVQNTSRKPDEVEQESIPPKPDKSVQETTSTRHENSNTIKETTIIRQDEVVQKTTLSKLEKNDQKNIPEKPDKTVQVTNPTEAGKIAQNITPENPEKTAQATIPHASSEKEEESTPPRYSKVPQETTSHISDKVFEKTTQSIPDKILRETTAPKINKTAQETTLRPKEKLWETSAPKVDKIVRVPKLDKSFRETGALKLNKNVQGTTPRHDKVAQEFILAKSSKIAQEYISSKPSEITQEATPVNSTKVPS